MVHFHSYSMTHRPDLGSPYELSSTDLGIPELSYSSGYNLRSHIAGFIMYLCGNDGGLLRN